MKIVIAIFMIIIVSCVSQKQRHEEKIINVFSENSDGPGNVSEFGVFIDSFITASLKKENIPGAAFVYVKGDKIFYMEGYGVSNLETNSPVDPRQTIFRIGSISKVFTVNAILQLADKNQIDLHRDINSYLTRVKVPQTFAKPITAYHLITHTAGLDEIRPGTQASDSQYVQPLGQFLKNKMVRLWEPGEIIMYSTYGITVGGLLIEDVTNQEYEKYMMHHIWKPLEMNSTNINVPGELKAKVALGYENVNGINIPQRWEWYHTTPASSINSTAEDMSHWMIAHLNQGRFEKGSLMSEKRMEEMLMHHESMHPAMYGMTYGFFEEYHNNLRFLHHGGNMAGFNSLVVLIPGKKEGFFFVSQHEGSSIRDHLQWAILDRYFKKQDSAVKIIPVSGDAVHRAGLFAGQYKQNTFCHSCERPTTSFTIDVSANADGTIQLNGRRWIESEQKLLFIREDGKSKIAFRSDSLNRITHMYFGGFWAFEKIK